MIRIFEFDRHREERGCIYTFFDQRLFATDGRPLEFVQDKVSVSYKGVVRGFHGDDKTWKLITCLHGACQLVVYDLDNDIKESITLVGDADNHNGKHLAVLVPPRHLNGHQSLADKCIFLYKWSEFYAGPAAQWSVHYDDETINPQWPICTTKVSCRDKRAPTLKEFRDNL
jgi:dTDP-4-dehydrorhamnose 3,5-epimerase